MCKQGPCKPSQSLHREYRYMAALLQRKLTVMYVRVRACTKIYQTHNQSKPVQCRPLCQAWQGGAQETDARYSTLHTTACSKRKRLQPFRFHLPFTQQQCSIPTPPHRAYHILHSHSSHPACSYYCAAHCAAMHCTAHRFLWLNSRSISQPRLILPYLSASPCHACPPCLPACLTCFAFSLDSSSVTGSEVGSTQVPSMLTHWALRRLDGGEKGRG